MSTPHLAMKFPTIKGEIVSIHGDQKTAREHYVASLKAPYEWEERRKEEKRLRREEERPRREEVRPRREEERPRREDGRPRREDMVGMTNLDPRMNEDPRVQPEEETVPICIGEPHQVTCIGSTASREEMEVILGILRRNVDAFAWTAADMPGIDPKIITHRQLVYKEARPVAQKRRKMEEERRKAVGEEVEKLLN